ncbi:TAXI family TRAP transporter solute-binding subunit [Thalassobaculum litoreum]|uniref:TRAP transporter solute receptor, TAXI family n=1 Tax=Thalassobaculum litoreum DSM 18839 TaxID=1123362 RepID=A0A8G2BLZ2_9PROT|nr:TAXI family TRAP transporter solute-binding subunit [Thalassobaculum litoreum]SDG28525.1 TRAP transporter solute receptor, TAXI family [Thalassobaculum litoreum DSM 18839]
MEISLRTRAVAAMAGAAALTFAGVAAAETKLPSTLTWTAYDTGSSGHAQSVAIGKAFKEKYDVNLRILPGKNDVSRLRPLQVGKVEAVANGVGTYFAQEAVFGFDKPDWGPQPLRLLMSSKGSAGLMVGVAEDTGVKEYKDLKGKRVAWVKSAPALNHNVTAILAFAGLTWDDVTKVEFAGFGASWEGMTNDQVDAAFAITVSGSTKSVASSPRGLVWPALPFDDTEGWKRMMAVAPYYTKNTVSAGTNIPKEGIDGQAYPYPILTVRSDMTDELAQSITEAMLETYDMFKDGAPGAAGWALANQTFEWAVPYHDGAIAAFKGAGVWTDAMQAHNDTLVARQKVLIDAWTSYSKDAPSDEDAFVEGWAKARVAALEAAGFDPVIR